MRRYGARQDANHARLRKRLREIVRVRNGLVEDASHIGEGWPDLMVVCRGQVVAIEVKDGAKPPSARKLTPDEQEFRDRWTQAGGRYEVVETEQQAEVLAMELIR